MLTKKQIREKLPHGSLQEVAEKSGVTIAAVTNFFSGKTKTSPKIQKAALEIAIKYEKMSSELSKELETILQ